MTAVQYDGPITIAVGQSRRSTQWQNRDLMWSQLVNRLEIPERTQESAKEYKALPKAQRDEIKDVGGFVGGVLKGGRRKADAITQRRLLTLDLDEVPADADPWDTVVLVLGCAAVLYSTHSHRPDAPRLRLVMPLSRAVSPEEYAAVARKIAQDIGIDMCDDTTYEPHRLMYWPSLSYDAEYRYEFSDGPWLDVDEQLKRYVDWHDPTEWPVSSRRAEALHRLAKKQGDPTAKDGVVGAFCSTYSVEDAIAEFLPDVYEKCDDGRYTFKGGSTTGGLVLYDNGLFAYSHHGTDPASGKLCNAFDLVRIHLFGNEDDAAAPGTPSSRLPSFVAMADEALQIPEVREELARKRLQKISAQFDEDGASTDEGEEDMSWTRDLTLTKTGKCEATIENVRIIMENDRRLKGRYRDTYFTPGRRGPNGIVYDWNLKDGAREAIFAKLSDLCISMETTGLPERLTIPHEVKLSEKAAAMYQQLERTMLLPFADGDVDAATAAILTNKLLQLAGGAVYDENGKAQIVHDQKLEVLDQLIEEANGQPVLVFYNYKHELDRLQARYPQAIHVKEENVVKRWNAKEIPILLANPASAGHGLNLQFGGHIAIWYSPTWNLEFFQQANKRLHRRGQAETVLIHTLMAKGTIDERIYDIVLRNKEAGQNALLEAVKARIKEVT